MGGYADRPVRPRQYDGPNLLAVTQNLDTDLSNPMSRFLRHAW